VLLAVPIKTRKSKLRGMQLIIRECEYGLEILLIRCVNLLIISKLINFRNFLRKGYPVSFPWVQKTERGAEPLLPLALFSNMGKCIPLPHICDCWACNGSVFTQVFTFVCIMSSKFSYKCNKMCKLFVAVNTYFNFV